MAMPTPGGAPPGWYTPAGTNTPMYWDGAAWRPDALPPPPPEPSGPRRRVRWWWIVGPVAAGLLVIVGFSIYLDQTGKHLVSADFQNGAAPFETGRSKDYTIDVVDGTYRLTSTAPEGPTSPALSFANLARTAYSLDLAADVRVDGPGAAASTVGVGCVNRTDNVGYLLMVSKDHGAAIVRYGQNNSPMTENTKASFQTGRTTRLRIVCAETSATGAGQEISGYIDDLKVAEANDATADISYRSAALVFGTQVDGTQARFDNVDGHLPQ